jgi:uncharacterized membrane protein YgcG
MPVVQRRGDPAPPRAPAPPGAPPAAPPDARTSGPPPLDDAMRARRKRKVLIVAILAFGLLGIVFPIAIGVASDWIGGVFAFIAGVFTAVIATVVAAATMLGQRAAGTTDDSLWHRDDSTASAMWLGSGSDSRPDSSPAGGYDSAADAGSSGSTDSGSSGGDSGSSGGGDSGGSSSSD